MARLKKGFFYSLSFSLIIALVFGLSLIAFKNFNFSQERFNEILIFDRVYELDKSIEQGFKDIFNLESGIIINKGTNITFSEALSNKNSQNFSNALDDYKLFLESNFSVILNIEDTKKRLPLIIIPNQITYYHENFGNSTIKVDAQTSNFAGFTVTVKTAEILSSNSCAGSGVKQNVYIDLFASGSSGSCSYTARSHGIIDLINSKGKAVAKIVVSDNDLDISAMKQINVTTSIDNLENPENMFITLPKGALYLNFSEFNIVKNSTIIIL